MVHLGQLPVLTVIMSVGSLQAGHEHNSTWLTCDPWQLVLRGVLPLPVKVESGLSIFRPYQSAILVLALSYDEPEPNYGWNKTVVLWTAPVIGSAPLVFSDIQFNSTFSETFLFGLLSIFNVAA